MNAQVKAPESSTKRVEDTNLMGLHCVHQDFLAWSLLAQGTNSALAASPDFISHVSGHSDLEASCPG